MGVMPGVYLITDGYRLRQQGRLIPVISQLIEHFSGHLHGVHIREQTAEYPASDREITKILDRLTEQASRFQVPLIVHRNIELAIDSQVAGVHLSAPIPQQFQVERIQSAGLFFNYSAHSIEEAEQVVALGAKHVYLSPIFSPFSKPDDRRAALGVATLEEATAQMPNSIIALGGISANTAGVCVRAGAVGVAVLSSVLLADDPHQEMQCLVEALQRLN